MPNGTSLSGEELIIELLDEVLCLVARYEIYSKAHAALQKHFAKLKPYSKIDDFQIERKLPRPDSLPILVAPFVLHGYFRAWQRKRGIDPDTHSPAAEKNRRKSRA